MPPKRFRPVTNSPTHTTTIISDVEKSHMFLAPNESSPATIGIHSCLVRCCEYEHFANILYQGAIIGLQPKDFLYRLNEMENKLKDDCQLDIERAAIIARLRLYLEQNEELFRNILCQIKNHLDQCMRDDLLIVSPQTYDELIQKSIQRNQLALNHDQAHRMRHFQFHNYNEANQPVNLINLQKITLTHFQLLVENIKPDAPNRVQLLDILKDLLDNSFFIIKHPSPPIATCSPPKNENVTAKVNCRLLCLLDTSSPQITIDNITPVVCYLSSLNQMEGLDVSYRQPQMDLETYSIVTTSNNRKIFSCADLSEIVLNQISAVPQRQQPSTGKPRYAPYVYRIDFYINVTVHFPHDPTPYQHCVIVQSAPFGLITNTSQSADLFAEVFLEDLKCWKPLSMISNATTSTSTTKNLAIPALSDIVDSIKRYFIYKTGIQPKYWVMPYIQKELSAVYNNGQISTVKSFHNVLAKILAQIDCMAEHPLLILFHDDGLFFGLCDSKQINKNLRIESKRCEKSICAIRFGSLQNTRKAKDVGVRVDFFDKSSTDVQNYTFETGKLSMELGSFIIKIALCQASRFENILYYDITNRQQPLQISKNMHIFVELYHSEKLRELCPHEQAYLSIWASFDNKENNNSKSSSPTQSFTNTITTGACANNNSYCSFNNNICPINQTQQVMQSPQLQYPQQQQYSQILHHSQPQYYSQTPIQLQPSYLSFSNTPQNNQQYINSAPEIIVITSTNQYMMSPECITQLLLHNFPQFSSSIQSNRIYHLDLNPPSQSFDTSQSTSLSSGESIIYETNTTDPTNIPDSDNNN